MDAPALRAAAQDDLEILVPLVHAYHDFEFVELSEADRRRPVSTIHGHSELGLIWLIGVGDSLAG